MSLFDIKTELDNAVKDHLSVDVTINGQTVTVNPRFNVQIFGQYGEVIGHRDQLWIVASDLASKVTRGDEVVMNGKNYIIDGVDEVDSTAILVVLR